MQDHRIQIISDVIEKFDLDALKSRIDNLKKANSSMVEVAVFGRFKAGKSSFLNHLFGSEVLTVGVTPVTAIVTRIRYGAEDQILVTFFDGSTRRVPFAELSEYVSELRNPKNEKSVSSVAVTLRSLKKYEGLQFVDTPGVDSVFRHNTETSLNWLPKVGVAVVAISSDSPLSKNDLSLIVELKKFTPRVAILLTKVDLLDSNQIDEISAFVKRQLLAALRNHLPTYLYSIKPGHENCRKEFADAVLLPLKNSLIETAEQIREFKIAALKNECQALLSVAYKAASQTDEMRESAKQLIKSEKDNFQLLTDELKMIRREYSGRARPFIAEELEKNKTEIFEKLAVALAEDLPKWRGGLWRLTRMFETWLREHVSHELATVSNEMVGTFLRPLNDSHVAFQRVVASFQARLAEAVKSAVDVDLPAAEFNSNIKAPPKPDVSFYRIFDSHLDLLSFLIPMHIFRKNVERHFRRQLMPELEKNLSRLASQWSEGIIECVATMEIDAKTFCESQLNQLANMLNTKQSRAAEIKYALDLISQKS